MPNWSEEDFNRLKEKQAKRKPGAKAPEKQTPKQKLQALGRLKAGTMNKTETAYAQHLEWRKHAGEIAWYKFEGVKLRLADKTFYSCDFFVMLSTGELQAHEVKGYWEDDARVKTKVAADQYPWQFIGVQKDGESWKYEYF